jgi:hypothetical protein
MSVGVDIGIGMGIGIDACVGTSCVDTSIGTSICIYSV